MTIEEKIENFKKSALKDATMQGNALIRDSEDNIRIKLAEYETKAKLGYENKLRIESNMIISKNNQDISKESLIIKQRIEKKRLELVDNLFADLEKKLKDYKKTSDYKDLLIKQIDKVREYAKDAKIVIYIDKTDKDILDDISNKTNTHIEVSETNIIGGIKAIIEEKSILLDYSFLSQLHEEKLNFTF